MKNDPTEIETTVVVNDNPDETVVVEQAEAKPTQYMPDVNMNNKLIATLKVLQTESMLPPQQVADAQAQFYHALIRGIVNTTDEESETFLTLILEYIATNQQQFEPKKIFRGINMINNLSDSQRTEFQIILRILVDTADPWNRVINAKAMNWPQIETNMTSSYAFTLLERLKNFYRI